MIPLYQSAVVPFELEVLLKNENVNFEETESSYLDWPWDGTITERREFFSVPSGSVSGGYAEQILKYASEELFSGQITRIAHKPTRNQDLNEIILETEGQQLLKFAIANGFRNIQNIVQKLKKGKCPYDYVEIMACPSGCINGGAQIRLKDGKTPKESIRQLESMYDNLPKIMEPGEDKSVRYIQRKWLNGENTDKTEFILHTSYHSVIKNIPVFNIKW